MRSGRPATDPGPTLHPEFLPRSVGLEVKRSNHPIPDQNRTNEIPKYALVPGNVSFEAILVIEEQPESFALDDQRVERGQDVNLFLRWIGNGIEGLRAGPVQCVARAFQLHRDQFLPADSRLQQARHGWLAW